MIARVLPTTVVGLILLFLAFPIVVVMVVSFSSATYLTFPPPAFGLKWYEAYFGNADWHYTSPALPAPLIEAINTRVARYTPASDALAFLAHYGEPSGGLSMPVLTLHTTRDPVVPFFHEGLLGKVAGGPWLLQRSVDRYGHDAFSTGELMTNFESLVGWVSSGQKPAN